MTELTTPWATNTDNLMSSRNSDHSDSTYWYIWNGDKPTGPFFFSRLNQMVHAGELTRDTKVRIGSTGEWVEAGSVTELEFPAASDLPSREPEPKVKVEYVSAPAPGWRWGPLDTISDFVSDIPSTFANQWPAVRTILSWVACVTVFTALAIVLFENFSLNLFSWTSPGRTYQSIWTELREKRKAKAPDAEWDAFADRARNELKPIIARLERSAGPENCLSQQLLWAGRDYLPKMLTDARLEESESEQKFADHFQRAQWLSEGLTINGSRQFPHSALNSIFTNDLVLVLGFLFVLFDIFVILWFVRTRLKMKSPL